MLRIQGGLSEAPKPGCSGTITSKLLDSVSKNGSQPGRPLAPCRKTSGGPEPPRSIRTLMSRTLCFDSRPGMPCSPRTARRNLPACGLNARAIHPGCHSMAAVDTERFRLRRFVERLQQTGECETHDKPIDLVDVAGVLEG